MENLVLITSNFPFGKGEEFIETEFPFLYKNFKRIIIISQNVKSQGQRKIPGDVRLYRYNTATSFFGFLSLPYLLIRNFSLLISIYKQEILFRNEILFTLLLKQKLLLIKKIIKALQLREFIKLNLSREKVYSEIVFYSYWLNTGAHAIGLLDNKNSIKIARSHHYDLYEENSRTGFLPFLRFSALKLDSIFFVSEHGRNYFINKTKRANSNLVLSRLGVILPHISNERIGRTNQFIIVSCSNLIPVKRVDFLIRSLGLVQIEREINWIHFGDGPLKEDLETLAGKIFHKKKGTKYIFKGFYPNQALLEFYSKNKIDLFVNVSMSEGVPVSIMEAQSFGIPVIATDTGGVGELVTKGTGKLLPIDFKFEDLAESIEDFANISPEEEKKLRFNVRNNIRLNFDARLNYSRFLEEINGLLVQQKHNMD